MGSARRALLLAALAAPSVSATAQPAAHATRLDLNSLNSTVLDTVRPGGWNDPSDYFRSHEFRWSYLPT